MKMIFQACQQLQGLKAVNAELLEKIVVWTKRFPRHLEVSGGKGQDFVQCLIAVRHRLHYGKYGCAVVFSTNLRSPSSTAGWVNRSQKISISRRSSSRGMGLIKRFAAALVRRSNFRTWAAVERATRNASPSAAIWLTSPTDCALLALILRPVSNRSRTTAFLKSRFSRG